MTNRKSVLMVCLGNTCRSPIAEAIFKDYIDKMSIINYWQVDSAGLVDWHLGESPNPRALSILQDKGIINYSHKTRIITPDDFNNFHWILAMDWNNLCELHRIKPNNSMAVIELLGNYDPNGEDIIKDPYCDPDLSGFLKAYEQCERSIENFFALHHKNFL